jgi:hypothetical protein
MVESKETDCKLLDFKCKLKAWKDEISQHKWLILLAIFLFITANVMSLLASGYVDQISTISAHDLILDNIPVLNLSLLFIYGPIVIIFVLLVYLTMFHINKFHIVLTQFSILILLRSFFIVLTHLGQPSTAYLLPKLPWIYQLLNFHNDLFFSGHTAIPFMAFLIFKKDKIGIFFLLATFVMAATVLFMHIHYSIDVFAAIFITYGAYRLGKLLLPRIK